MRKGKLNIAELTDELTAFLRKEGPTSGKVICQQLNVSQASLSRLVTKISGSILTLGRGPSTQYALHRLNSPQTSKIPIYQIEENATSELFGTLHSIEPRGYYFKSTKGELTALYADLPYFLFDLKPSGFLGRLIPTKHPEFRFPNDINLWNTEQWLAYLTKYSWNNVGNFILGDDAFKLFLTQIRAASDSVESKHREKKYLEIADEVLVLGAVGSSAGGEQPKFLVTKVPENVPVLVKFSPPLDSAIGLRSGDLLICEHIAHETLHKFKIDSATSEIIVTKERVFLEVERFDRTRHFGRRGLISLGAVDAEFVGLSGSWSSTASELLKLKKITEIDLRKIRWLELFGKLIANSDMHLFNLSFYFDGNNLTGLSPVYDMTPMLFAPQNNQLVERVFNPEIPSVSDADIWEEVYVAAKAFWKAVEGDSRISNDFKKIVKNNLVALDELKKISQLLPRLK